MYIQMSLVIIFNITIYLDFFLDKQHLKITQNVAIVLMLMSNSNIWNGFNILRVCFNVYQCVDRGFDKNWAKELIM
jgi:hypothetical protein